MRDYRCGKATRASRSKSQVLRPRTRNFYWHRPGKCATLAIVRATSIFLLVIALTLSRISTASDIEEIALFNSDGKPVAYIAEDLTIYMWSGEPVAYLSPANNQGHGFNVYGFNGHHLGWFVKGVIRDHDGDASCGLKSVVSSPQFEPFKSFKQFKPFKSFKEYEPAQPAFSKAWSETTCSLVLRAGTKE